MGNAYKHTQRGQVILIGMGIAILLVLTGMLFVERYAILIPVLCILLVSAILFHSLTIEISNSLLIWKFGPGIFKKSIPLADIESARVVRNPWCYGWGIHLTPHGWLYNVSGLDAVEIQLKNRKRLRLGTDEPDALLRAIERAKAECKGA